MSVNDEAKSRREPLREPFDRALELCVELSEGESRRNWTKTLAGAQSFADREIGASADEIRAQSSSLLVLLLLSYLGEAPPSDLVRELERRAWALPTLRSDADARGVETPDEIRWFVETICIALRVSLAFSPSEMKS